MKKLAGLIAVASIFAVSTSAFAQAGDSYSAIYDSVDNDVTISSLADSYSTVLITKDGGEDNDTIVYIDQNNDTFGAPVNFLLKASPSDGYYKVKLGSDNDSLNPNPGVMYFTISNESDWIPDEVQMTFVDKIVDENGTESRMGWYATRQSIEGLYSLKIYINDGNGNISRAGFGLKDAFGVEGSGEISVGFQLEGMPGSLADESLISVYLSPDKVSNFKGQNN